MVSGRRTSVDELEITRGERALAAVLAAFVLVGLVWAYTHVDRRATPTQPTAAEEAAIGAHANAANRLFTARAQEARTRDRVDFTREQYRAALDAGQPASRLERDYRAAERDYAAAQREVVTAERQEADTAQAAAIATQRLSEESARRARSASRLTFAFRLLLVLVAVGLAELAVVRLRGSRLHPLAIATLAASGVLALVMGADYVTDYVDWQAGGPLVLSLGGIALTLVAFVALQRFLARRVPLWRVRKGCCPACGYPVRGTHCEGCGRAVVVPCPSCAAERRVGSAHCGSCGAA